MSIQPLSRHTASRGLGFTQTWEEADEGFYELERSPRLVKPKSYVSLYKTT
ncbi:MAG: hypothetical protein QXL15_00300 [Candidatus Korarchaeota archaeon]